MEVTIRIATKSEPNPSVSVSGSMRFNSVESLDAFLDTVKTARAWLKKQKGE